MEFQFSDMVNQFQTGIFAMLNEKKEELIRRGRKIYNLSIGTPRFFTGAAYYESYAGCLWESRKLQILSA